MKVVILIIVYCIVFVQSENAPSKEISPLRRMKRRDDDDERRGLRRERSYLWPYIDIGGARHYLWPYIDTPGKPDPQFAKNSGKGVVDPYMRNELKYRDDDDNKGNFRSLRDDEDDDRRKYYRRDDDDNDRRHSRRDDDDDEEEQSASRRERTYIWPYIDLPGSNHDEAFKKASGPGVMRRRGSRSNRDEDDDLVPEGFKAIPASVLHGNLRNF